MTKPVVLCVLDGWGYRPDRKGNAIVQAKTPNMDRLFSAYPHNLLQASEGYVGLPEGQMGNSEVGHTNLGAGRVVLQDLPRINKAVEEDTLKDNLTFRKIVDSLKANNGTCHVMGLLSPGGVHSSQKHFEYIVHSLSELGIPVAVHAFLDGRDTPPKSARGFIESFPHRMIATVSGRFYAMDRDNRWERVKQAYDAMVSAKGAVAVTALEAIDSSYQSDITDEFVIPTAIGNYQGMKDGDAVLMINFRADRAREILTTFTDPNFNEFTRDKIINFSMVAGMVSYSETLDGYMPALFVPEQLSHTLGEIIADAGLKQLRIAETEKYAHVTFFFNGGEEKQFKGEDRILIPSPKVSTYDLQPQMSAVEVTDKMVEAIRSDTYDLIVANYANTDMVGHTGIESAAIESVEAVDLCMGKIADAVLEMSGALLITADHGNVEVMIDEATGQPHTAHTLNPVPFIIVSEKYKNFKVSDGCLCDVAPTVLTLMNLEIPDQMTGQVLLSHVQK